MILAIGIGDDVTVSNMIEYASSNTSQIQIDSFDVAVDFVDEVVSRIREGELSLSANQTQVSFICQCINYAPTVHVVLKHVKVITVSLAVLAFQKDK